jgi:hypothetical protein
MLEADVDMLTACLDEMPTTTINTLCNTFKAESTAWTKAGDLSERDLDIYHAFLACDVDALYAKLEDGLSSVVAEVACYYLNWEYRAVKQPLPALLS